MARYVALMNYTQEGLAGVKGALERLEQNSKGFEAMGAKLIDFYWVMGQYDMVAIMEAPDDETAAKVALAYGMKGTGRGMTLRAFTPAEMKGIIAKLP
jgi:uncharacterized protein with GYD domain